MAVTGADEPILRPELCKNESGFAKVSESQTTVERLAFFEAIRIVIAINRGIDQQESMELIDFEDMTILLRLSEEKFSIVQSEIKGNSPSIANAFRI